MKSVLIYPYGEECSYLAEYHELLDGLEPKGLVKLKGWEDGKKEYIKGEWHIPVFCNFEEGLQNVNPEVIWFADFQFPLDFEKYYLPYLKIAVGKGKQIIASQSLKLQIQKYTELVDIQYYKLDCDNNYGMDYVSTLFQINTPIIFITSLFEGLGKFHLQLGIRKLPVYFK